MAANHSETNVINVPINALIALLRDPGFANFVDITPKSENFVPTGVVFEFTHGVSFSSWGENITITLTYVNDSTTKVDIYSECRMPTQIIDWGKNKRVVTGIFEGIYAGVGRFVQGAPVQEPQPQQPENSKFCIKCGTKLDGDSVFCFNCGTKLG